MVVPNFPKNSHTTRFYLYCLVMNSKRLNNVTLCPSSLSTFHILIFSEETNNWNIVESIGINLQEWCLWGSLWKIPHIMATLQNTWSPLAVLIFSFDWLKLKKKKKIETLEWLASWQKSFMGNAWFVLVKTVHHKGYIELQLLSRCQHI